MNPGQTPYPVFDQATLDAMLGVGAVPSVPSSSVPFPTAGVESAYSMLSLGPQLSFETDGGDADAAFASEPVGKTGRRRVRVTKACDACSKKKIKCDGLQPACTRCFVNNIACAYSRDTKKRGPAPGSIVSLHKRLKRLEYLLEKATGGKGEEFFDELEDGAPDDEDHESGHSDDDALEAVNIKQEPEAEPRRIKPATGTVMPKPGKVQGPGASAAKLPVEQELPRDAQSPVSPQESPGADLVADFVSGGPTVLILDAASPAQAEPLFAGSSGQVVKQMMAPIRARSVGGQLAGSPPHGVVPLPRSPSGSLFDDLPRLPPQEILDSLVADYFAHLGPATSFIHRQTFMRNLRAQPPLLLYSIYAVAAPYSEKIGANRFEFAASMFERAKRLLYPALELPPSLVTIQALLHLVLYGVTSWAHGAIAYQFTGIAIMMARQMLLNLDPDSDRFSKEATRRNMRWVEKETRRRVWWALYNLDRWVD